MSFVCVIGISWSLSVMSMKHLMADFYDYAGNKVILITKETGIGYGGGFYDGYPSEHMNDCYKMFHMPLISSGW